MRFQARLMVGFFFACQLVSAQPDTIEDELKRLAYEPQWLRLGHYQSTWSKPYKSDVDDSRFFLSATGKSDPESEIRATFDALTSDKQNGDAAAACRFPARSLWLTQQLPQHLPAWSIEQCQELGAWRQKIKPSSITLIFPGSYVNSPSSMFGHTLLRLDSTIGNNHVLLSWALNYGATADVGNDGGLLYAVKGLTGGYQGTFNLVPYFEKVNEYNDLDNRNIFEYKLNLTREEITFMLLHTWELKGIEFDYFYFDENCAYQLLTLLEVARPELKLTEQFKLKAIPSDTVRAVEHAGLIEQVVTRPAKKTEFEARTRDFNKEEITLTKELVFDFDHTYPLVQQLPETQRQKLIDAAYRYARLRANEFGEQDEMRQPSFQLLQAISAQTSMSITEPEISLERSEHGHGSQRLGLSLYTENTSNEKGIRLHYRPVYHDWLDPSYGYLKGANIEMFNTAVNITENAIELDQFVAAQVESLRLVSPFFRQMSWFAGGGLTRKLSQPNRVNGYIQTGRGYAKSAAASTFYGFAAARYETYNGLMPGIRAGVVGNNRIAFLIEISGYYSFVRDQQNIRFNTELRYPVSTNFSIAASYISEWDDEKNWPRAELGAQWFFN